MSDKNTVFKLFSNLVKKNCFAVNIFSLRLANILSCYLYSKSIQPNEKRLSTS